MRILLKIIVSFLFFTSLQRGNSSGIQNNDSLTNPYLDSLFTVFQTSTNDTIKVKLLNEISWSYSEYNFQKGLEYGNSALQLSKKINWILGEAESYCNLGEAYRYKGEINKSIKNYESALELYRAIDNQKEIAQTLRRLGISYYNISNFTKSFEYYNQSLEIYKRLNDKEGLSKILSYLGILHGTFNNHTKALDYFYQSLKLERELKNKLNEGVQLGNIGTTYYELKDYNRALQNMDMSLTLLEESGDYYDYSIFLSNAGKIYAAIKNYKKAFEHYRKSLKYAEDIGDEYGIAYQYGQMGSLYLSIVSDSSKSMPLVSKDEMLKNSIEYLKKSIDKFGILGNEEEKKNFMFSLSQAYKINGNFLNALETYITADQIQDSINSDESKKLISELEIKQELDIKEKEIELLNQQKENENIIKNSLIGFIVFVVIILGTVFFFYIKKYKDNKVLQENIRIRKQTENELKQNQIELEKYKNNLEVIVKERTENLEKEITERVQFEKALKVSEDKYRRLIELAPDAFFQGNKNGDFITINKKAVEQTGYSYEELMNMNMKDLFSPNILNDKPLRYDLLQKGETIKVEREIIRKDGSTLFIEMNSRMMPDETYQSFFRDITKQKLALMELEKQKIFFEQMYLQSATSTQILDSDGWCLRINPKLTELFGVRPEDIEGHKYNIFEDIEIKRNGIDKILRKVIEERKPLTWVVNFDIGAAAESQNIKVDKPEKIWFQNIAYPIVGSDDEIMYLIIQHENITDRKRAEEEIILAKQKAESVSNAKTIFLANMSHELRTPLVGILGYSELLAKELKSAETREMAEGINRTGRRLLNTLSLVLDLTRVESDKFEMQIKPVDLIVVLKEAYDNFKGAVSIKNLKFNFNPHTDTQIIKTDIEMLNTVFENLINNAIKFTSAGEINIITGLEHFENNEYVFVNIEDTGIGMKDEDLPKIFTEFRQLSEGTTKRWPGTGLGLSITKKYVEMLAGKIFVESKEGVGSKFKIMLKV